MSLQVLEHDTPPLFSQIDDVYKGKSVLMGYKSGLEVAVYQKYTMRNGNAMLKTVKNDAYPRSFLGWQFDPMGRFRAAFDPLIRRSIEAGLIHYWKGKVLRKMRETHPRYEEVVVADDQRISFTLEHLQGAFIVWAICCAVSVVAFLGEIVFLGTSREKASHTFRNVQSKNMVMTYHA